MINSETSIPGSQPLFKTTTLINDLRQDHPLIVIANKINWDNLITSIQSFYVEKVGRPAKSIRLMIGLLLIKYLYDLSDEDVVAQWEENIYFQAFTGQPSFVKTKPCSATLLCRFRKKIGKTGADLIFAESVRVHGDNALESQCIADTTVQEKNITFPTDSKLILAAINLILRIGLFLKISFRRTFTKEIKNLKSIINFGRNNKDNNQKENSIKRLRVIANSLLNTLIKKLPSSRLKVQPIQKLIGVLKKAINQIKTDKNKIYSIHEPHVNCISKGKANKKYEFGNKVSLIISKSKGIILGALSLFNNPYDGDTLDPAIQQLKDLHNGYAPKIIGADRGYRGRSNVNGVEIITPYDNKKGLLSKISRLIKKLLRRRTSIEPVIGHLKSDHRLSRNLLKGQLGDIINPMLAAAAFNFLKYARVEYDRFHKPPKTLARRIKNRNNKFYGLPLWRPRINSLF